MKVLAGWCGRVCCKCTACFCAEHTGQGRHMAGCIGQNCSDMPSMCMCCYAGHQLHFDSDDEGQGGVRHPIITAIVYLSNNVTAAPLTSPSSPQPPAQAWVGGPTLMTDQVLGGPLATQGWLAYPETNRAVFFDGRYLHGAHKAEAREWLIP